MIARSPADFRAAIEAHRLDPPALAADALEHALAAVRESGMLVVGEPHGVRETPGVLYSLTTALDTHAVAFEWSHEEMDPVVQELVRSGSLGLEALWSLGDSAEFFCGDGRITAGHFALLQRLRDEDRLGQVILFDRLDPEPAPPDWQVRDRQMAERLLQQWNRRDSLLVLVGAFHAQLDVEEGVTMTMHVAGEVPLRPAMIEYAEGRCWSRGHLHDVGGPMPSAPIAFRLPTATPAVVPAIGI